MWYIKSTRTSSKKIYFLASPSATSLVDILCNIFKKEKRWWNIFEKLSTFRSHKYHILINWSLTRSADDAAVSKCHLQKKKKVENYISQHELNKLMMIIGFFKKKIISESAKRTKNTKLNIKRKKIEINKITFLSPNIACVISLIVLNQMTLNL